MNLQSIKNQIKIFFAFNKQQERGAFVLIVLIIISFGIHQLLPLFLTEKPYDYSEALAEIEAWKTGTLEVEINKFAGNENKYPRKDESENIVLNPFPFNPNGLSKEKWLEMGMPESVVKTILNYESKGGRFFKTEDLSKIYGLKPEIYEQIKDFVEIPDLKKPNLEIKNAITSSPNIVTEKIILDINRADSIDFLKIPGIGPFYAGQIVKYRNRLGGYISIKQLNELYKMDSSRVKPLISSLILVDTLIKKIDLNKCDFKTALNHPYMNYALVQKIFNYRNKLGRINGFYQLKKDSIITESQYQKLEPYFKVD